MLNPRDRTLLLENLRPPDGYRLDRAVATSYSLDLVTLLAAPLAFTFFDWEDTEGKNSADPIALLESLRRHAQNIYVFSQTGEIKLPPPSQRLVTYLERSVVPVRVPSNKKGESGVFHPKVWLIRYVADDAPVRYRLMCGTRNLTFDRSWDLVVRLDGELIDRTRAIGASKPLGEFISSLPQMALRPMLTEARSAIEEMAAEVQRVRFETDEAEEVAFWPLGIDGHRRLPFAPERSSRPLLVMAPFLSSTMLNRLTKDREGACTLVSRPDALAALPPETVQRFGAVYALTNEAQDPEEDREDAERSELAGLHAKLFIEDDGWHSRMYLGSANATTAAFERNVEFLVELKGKKGAFGINALLGEEGAKDTLRALLQAWQAGERVLSEEDAIAQAIDERLAVLRRLAGAQPFSLHCTRDRGADDLYLAELRSAGELPAALRGNLACWLTTQGAETSKTIDSTSGVLASFGPIDVSSLSAFLACRVSASEQGISRESQFVLNLPIDGVPEDRLERLLAAQIKDRDRLLRLLLLLLQPDGATAALVEAIGNVNEGGSVSRGADSVPLFEALVRATVGGKQRLIDMGRLLADLQRTAEGKALIPDALLDLWNEVKELEQDTDERSAPAR